MPAVLSAGILLYRRSAAGELEVWIAHMGGPFWARKDEAAWSIPKGEYAPPEDPLTVALREFEEEIGTPAPAVSYDLLGEFRQPSGKVITVFTAEHDFHIYQVTSNTFPLEWPPHSGQTQHFPEIDEARWLTVPDARPKLTKGQRPILEALLNRLD